MSVVVVDKSSGHFKEVKSFGSSSDATAIASLEQEARQYIATFGGQQAIDFEGMSPVVASPDTFMENIESVLINGPQLLLDKVYDEIGFNVGQPCRKGCT